jgi:diguanylate cyclase (GGDEF)-like protein
VALARARELGEADPARRHLLARAEQLGHRLSTTAAGALARMVAGPRLVAEVLCERGQCEQAWVRLNQAASALPQGQGAGPAVRQERAALQLARGRCLLLLERPDQALPELDGALTALHPDRDLAEHIQALELRSRARERAGDTQGALADVRTLAEQIWVRHRRQIGGFMDQVWGRAGAEGRRRTLEAREQVLIRTAEQDPLTALVNRRGVERFWAGLGPGESMCLVMVDIDHFKDVNDRFGHAVGDAVLREVAAILSSSLRTVDQVARWGGEEFLIALPAGSAELGAEAAARVRRRVAEHDWSRLAAGLALTVSAGVASGSAHDLAGVLHRADAALYEAKRAGRNRVVTS